jgi:hypothetical protein
MLGSVLAKTVRDARRGLAWWSVGIAALVLLTVSAWPSIEDNDDLARAVEDSHLRTAGSRCSPERRPAAERSLSESPPQSPWRAIS